MNGAPAPSSEGIGDTLRDLRLARAWRRADLAAASGVPVSTISKIENALMQPSLVHAINLAAALGANLGSLTHGNATRPEAVSVMRANRRPRLDRPGMEPVLEDLLGNFAADARSGEDMIYHPGAEICRVRSGSILYPIPGQVHDLVPGTTIHFHATAPHRWEKNAAAGPNRVVRVFSDGLSF